MKKEQYTEAFLHKGLSKAEVEQRRQQYGENVLTPPKRRSLWQLYLEKYQDPIIQFLLFAGVVSLVLAFIHGEIIETIGIFIAIFLATTIGFYFERDAAKKFAVLNAIGEEQPVKVLRDGEIMLIPRKEIVVGDLVIVETGDEIPADGDLVKSTDLQIDESSLTGEPLADKHAEESLNDPHATYPSYRVMRSTMVMNGRGEMVVTAVGNATEIGKVAKSAAEDTDVETPLNIQLKRLGAMINKIGFTLSIAAFVIFLTHHIFTHPELWHSDNYLEMAEVVLQYFMMTVTLIVMAVPEGLPMAVTLCLALNMRRMLVSNNLVRKLHACETMGAVTVICTDKTGTLTQNKMTVGDMQVFPSEDTPTDDISFLTTAIAVNSTAFLGKDGQGIGNPTEVALLEWAHQQFVSGKVEADYQKVREEVTVLHQQPFSTQLKYMTTTIQLNDGCYLLMKGAPEMVITCCDLSEEVRMQVNDLLRRYQEKAMRTLAFAWRKISSAEDSSDSLAHLHLQAVCGISDPVRVDVPDAVGQCQQAGIEVKMVTGDHSGTAKEIGRQIGIWDDQTPEEALITGADFAALSDEEAFQRVNGIHIISRARPADKQRFVQLLQKQHQVVAVTGDGTNDAPALHHAHVGLSLGSGTSVAKEASDITLLDDSFRSIADAVMWGRSLYKNIQRFLFFQLVVNVTALLLVLGGSLLGTELPLTVTQILWINLIMDTFAAMALASLAPSREVMQERPRSTDSFIITKGMAWGIMLLGLLFFGIMFTLLVYFLHDDADIGIHYHEMTIFFTVFVMLQFWNLFNAKTLGSTQSAFRKLWRERGFLLVLVLILIGQVIIVQFGGKMFRTDGMSLKEWLIVIGSTSVVVVLGELYRLIKRRICKV